MKRSRRWRWVLASAALLALAVGVAGWLLFAPLQPVRRSPLQEEGEHFGAAVSPDERLLVFLHPDGLWVVDYVAGQALRRVEEIAQWVGFLPGSRGYVGIHVDGALSIWDTDTWTRREAPRIAVWGRKEIAWTDLSPDGTRAAVLYYWDDDHFAVEICDLQEERQVCFYQPIQHWLGFTSEGAFLVTAPGANRSDTRILELGMGAPREVPVPAVTPSFDADTVLPDGLVLGRAEGRLRLLDPRTGRLVRDVPARLDLQIIHSISSGGRLCLSYSDGFYVHDLLTGELLLHLRRDFARGRFLSSTRFCLVGDAEVTEWEIPPRGVLRLREGTRRWSEMVRDRWEAFQVNPPRLPWP